MDFGFILQHQTKIHMNQCVVENGVYKQICYDLLTLDISMRWKKDPMVGDTYFLNLPEPDPANFIPFEDVDERVILKWIADHEPLMVIRQERQTPRLIQKIHNDYLNR